MCHIDCTYMDRHMNVCVCMYQCFDIEISLLILIIIIIMKELIICDETVQNPSRLKRSMTPAVTSIMLRQQTNQGKFGRYIDVFIQNSYPNLLD